jgi:hypothetical protein
MTQLERDLTNRIRSRLGQWAKDSIQLFEMADLDDEAHSAMLCTLMSFTAYLLTEMHVGPEKAGKILAEAMDEMRKMERRRHQ